MSGWNARCHCPTQAGWHRRRTCPAPGAGPSLSMRPPTVTLPCRAARSGGMVGRAAAVGPGGFGGSAGVEATVEVGAVVARHRRHTGARVCRTFLVWGIHPAHAGGSLSRCGVPHLRGDHRPRRTPAEEIARSASRAPVGCGLRAHSPSLHLAACAQHQRPAPGVDLSAVRSGQRHAQQRRHGPVAGQASTSAAT
jgi:hypothetical protein